MQVSSLAIYPVKSMAGIALSTMSIASLGPAWDRRWMVVDDSGQFLTQRQLAKMCLISATVDAGQLTLSCEGQTAITVEHTPVRQRSVVVWADTVEAEDCGDKVADWLSMVLQCSCRLVFMPEHTQRWVDTDFAKQQETVSFADGFPFLLMSAASLESFNQHLDQPVSSYRFRPNIVVSGCEAFAEDGWQRIRIGEIEFSVVKPCSRCVIPSIDPATGLKQVEVSKALASHRRRDGAVYFGQNLLHRGHGEIGVGDSVEAL
ncbi:MOSC domain-containing protein [Oceanicoccus sagamiensis]|uniref:MOSC domain-containing protein n=1 Tax=Oceanicoccus sagamiensis TaxID=716816 RepID=A0A1X9NCB3_9GAMM|nr:MOSC N-terminal beta barrel domain-containing protein [Oceanicoccus sagamiensis]ARN75670.1 hypothetical protein BST96_17090 [Oceanicoccus sagamiensis]